jgi:hypothetical protein
MALSPDQILDKIKDLPLKEGLQYLVANKIKDFLEKGYSNIKKILQDKFNESKYAFVPDKEQARQLRQLGTHPDYNQLSMLIPNYPYTDLIRTGLLVNSYLETPNKHNDERAKQIKTEIAKRPNGIKLLKITNLPTTPFFSVILNHLFEFKKKGYSESQLSEKFDEIVDGWEKSSLFVKSDDAVEKIKKFCEEQTKLQKNTIFLLGMKQAAVKVEKAIEELEYQQFFKNIGYGFIMKKTEEGVEPRVEVTVYFLSSGYLLK